MPKYISPSYMSPFSFYRMSEVRALMKNQNLKEVEHVMPKRDGSFVTERYDKWQWIQRIQSGNFRLALNDLEAQLRLRCVQQASQNREVEEPIDSHFGQCLLHLAGEIFLTWQEIEILDELIGGGEGPEIDEFLAELRECEARLAVCKELLTSFSDLLNSKVIDELDFGEPERSIFISRSKGDEREFEMFSDNEAYRRLVKGQLACVYLMPGDGSSRPKEEVN